MTRCRTFRSSSFLIVIAIIILGLGFSMAYYVRNAVDSLEFDAMIINETGIIRGSIQRATKMALSEPIVFPAELIHDVDDMFSQFISSKLENTHDGVSIVVFDGLVALQEEWLALRSMFNTYRFSSSAELRADIINKSELCWEMADSVVLKAQIASEGKMSSFNLFYRILGLNAIAAIIIILYVIFIVRKKLEFESLHDSLTDLQNRRSFDLAIHSEMARSVRYSSIFTLVLFDMDEFKLINDNFGHGVGDKALVALACVVRNSIRESDTLYRIGGDEFAIICPETSADHAFQLAENVREKVEHHTFQSGMVQTISLGIAEYKIGFSKEHFLQFADKALYEAKNNGRNSTRIYHI